MSKPLLGIMTVQIPSHPPFPEQGFFRFISKAGRAQGIPVLVFHPHRVDFATMTVTGFQLSPAGKWTSVTAPVPPLIYDRCFYLGGNFQTKYKPFIDRLQQDPRVRFLGIGLKGKWQLYQIARKHPVLSRFVPPTQIIEGPEVIQHWLKKYPAVILKPASGSLGIGVIKVTKLAGQAIRLEGRQRNNAPFSCQFPSFSPFIRFAKTNLLKGTYLIQPYLSLCTKEGTPFDLRLLVQKNESGQWTTTGKAIRIGQKTSITSNLHGGGRAMSFETFAGENYTPEQRKHIIPQISLLETWVPQVLEKHHGPLVELGIDIGIDTRQKVWLIEVNSKPGRQIFEQLNDKEAIIRSQLNPLYYAKYLMESQ